MRAAEAIDQVFAPAKMNISLLGNRVPHLHGWIMPRYYGDPAPGRPIAPGDPIVTLTPEESRERAQKIRDALDNIVGAQ